MKSAYIKIYLIVLIFVLSKNLYAQNYIPESSISLEDAEIILEYHHESGSNRDLAKFIFKDGFEINLDAVCKGDYPWCIRANENDQTVDLGALKMEFYGKTIIVETKIDSCKKYMKYLDMLAGKYKKVK